MTNGQKAYRKFLKSEFWIELSERIKSISGCCERCGETSRLQAHHKSYPSDWYQTTVEHLEILCRSCHKNEHGILGSQIGNMIIYRHDVQFSRFIYWNHYLKNRMGRLGVGLKNREIKYLNTAVELYPPKPDDACMKFHVEQTFIFSTMAHTFK